MSVLDKEQTKTTTEYTSYPESWMPDAIYPVDEGFISSSEANLIKNAKSSLRRQKFEVFMVVLIIVMVGAFFAMLLYPQQQLSELSRDNSDLKDSITVLKREVIDAEENLNGITDMDAVRAQALSLGMQDPDSNQLVIIPMPSDDKLVTVVTYDAFGISEDAYNSAIDNLADYYLNQATR